MIPKKILSMETGPLMDELITSILRQIEANVQFKAWSSDKLAALELRDFISSIGCDIVCTKFAMSPADLAEYCSIQDHENKDMNVSTSAAEIPESICRAFLLYHYKFYGDHMNAKYERVLKEARSQTTKIFQLPAKRE